MSGHGGHLGWRSVKPNINFKGDHPRTISPKFGYTNVIGLMVENVNPHRLNVKLSQAKAAMFDDAWKN